MARCGFCRVEVDRMDLWKHQRYNHPEEMRARSEKGRLSPRRAEKGDGKGDKGQAKDGPSPPCGGKEGGPAPEPGPRRSRAVRQPDLADSQYPGFLLQLPVRQEMRLCPSHFDLLSRSEKSRKSQMLVGSRTT